MKAWVVFAPALLLAACAAQPYVGSMDCKVIAPMLRIDSFRDTCAHCQGQRCEHVDCTGFPCRDEVRVIEACSEDADCSKLGLANCTKHGFARGVCMLADAAQ